MLNWGSIARLSLIWHSRPLSETHVLDLDQIPKPELLNLESVLTIDRRLPGKEKEL